MDRQQVNPSDIKEEMKILKINGKRKFTFNGRRYKVQNFSKPDKKGNKYYLTMQDERGFYAICHEKNRMAMTKFKTIKDAQRFVSRWDDWLEFL